MFLVDYEDLGHDVSLAEERQKAFEARRLLRDGDTVVGEHALDVQVVDREVGGAPDRRAVAAARGLARDAVDLEVADVVGEAEHYRDA